MKYIWEVFQNLTFVVYQVGAWTRGLVLLLVATNKLVANTPSSWC